MHGLYIEYYKQYWYNTVMGLFLHCSWECPLHPYMITHIFLYIVPIRNLPPPPPPPHKKKKIFSPKKKKKK